MTDKDLYIEIKELPPALKKEVKLFIDFLKTKQKPVKKIKKRKFGYAKGAFIIKPGFDDPLEDFKDYM
ncbi:MAG: DUF2281 domain-containing protein [Chitinophagaceae bacterium]|jgi:cellobiose-specific phosphotransferase system component IIB|nr:DUF2281 domain-containing protein [Chitinophagaceae bacterium]